MLVLILHRMLAKMEPGELLRFLRGFLPAAHESAFNYIAVVGMLIAPTVAVVALADDPGSARFVLTAIGLVLVVLGPLLTSNRLAEPNYGRLLAMDPDHPPPDFAEARARYIQLNWVRAAITWVAFALFLAALVEPL
jgi:hypothetical protein